MVLEVFLNGCFEFGDALEHAATDLIAGDQAEEAFDLAEPRNLSTTLRHRRFLFTDSFLLLWKWRVG